MAEVILYLVVGIAGGSALGFFWKEVINKGELTSAKSKADMILQDSESISKERLLEARDKAMKIELDAKRQADHGFRKVEEKEKHLIGRESQMDQKEKKLLEDDRDLKRREQEIAKNISDFKTKEGKLLLQLEEIASMSVKEAKDLIVKRAEQESAELVESRLKKHEATIKERAEEISKEIIGSVIGKYAHEVSSDKMVTMVELTNDDMKGRIIGKEGRNINAFEKVSGVDVIIDDTPNTVIISGFDLYRRYIAKVAMESLVKDGRIHPARIEDAVHKAKKEIEKTVETLGSDAIQKLGLTGFPPEIVTLIGKLNFRTSYGQNQLQHAIEVAYLASSMADEVGADATLCRKGGLVHDIGKTVSHEIGGKHATIGGAIARKFNMDDRIVNCIEAHHEDVEFTCIEAALVQAADVISASRPGARSEKIDNYVQRLTQIEKICTDKEGVHEAFAIQAGREVRIMVKPEEVSDAECTKLARRIAKEIEKEVVYPGVVKVQIIRESRITEFAR